MNDKESKVLDVIGQGSLLFQNNHLTDALLAEIKAQLELCTPSEVEGYIYRINWQICGGKQYGY